MCPPRRPPARTTNRPPEVDPDVALLLHVQVHESLAAATTYARTMRTSHLAARALPQDVCATPPRAYGGRRRLPLGAAADLPRHSGPGRRRGLSDTALVARMVVGWAVLWCDEVVHLATKHRVWVGQRVRNAQRGPGAEASRLSRVASGASSSSASATYQASYAETLDRSSHTRSR